MERPEPSFYFALPRLLARTAGGSGRRGAGHDWEAKTVGALVHGTAWLFAFATLLGGRSAWTQLLLLLPLTILVWIFWLLFFYASSLLIRLFAAGGIMRRLPRSRAQSIMVGIVTTCFAFLLIRRGSWTGLVGVIWIGAVSLNLLAAAFLALLPSHGAAGE